MPRVTLVKSARKEIPSISVRVGDSYYHWKMMVGGRGVKRMSKTPPKRQQLTNSAFLQGVYDIEDAISALTAGPDLETDRDDIAQQFRDLAQETQDSLDNMPEGLQQGPTGELLQERIDTCEAAADELEGIDFSDAPEEGASEEDKAEYWEGKLEEIQGVSIEV